MSRLFLFNGIVSDWLPSESESKLKPIISYLLLFVFHHISYFNMVILINFILTGWKASENKDEDIDGVAERMNGY